MGIDKSADFIKFAKARANHEQINRADFIVCDGAHLPLLENLFDCAVAIDSLEHVNRPKDCLSEINHTLNPNSMLYFGVPNRYHLTLFKASHTNVRTRLRRWYHRQKGQRILWYKSGFSDFETLFTYNLLKRFLKESGFRDFHVLPPSNLDKSSLLSLLWRIPMTKHFKPSFSVLALK